MGESERKSCEEMTGDGGCVRPTEDERADVDGIGTDCPSHGFSLRVERDSLLYGAVHQQISQQITFWIMLARKVEVVDEIRDAA